jgi:predicted house-cleaning NTP pyrophosphatase (Maf/HAM1 superfamily)
MDKRCKAVLLATPSYCIGPIHRMRQACIAYMAVTPNIDRELIRLEAQPISDMEVREHCQLLADIEVEDVVSQYLRSTKETNNLPFNPTYYFPDHYKSASSYKRDLNVCLALSSYSLLYKEGSPIPEPKNVGECRALLELIRGTYVEIYTAHSIVDIATQEEVQEVSTAAIQVRDMTDAFIEAYINTGEVYLSAASLFSNRGSLLVNSILGNPSMVSGLNTSILLSAMRHFGHEPHHFWEI